MNPNVDIHGAENSPIQQANPHPPTSFLRALQLSCTRGNPFKPNIVQGNVSIPSHIANIQSQLEDITNNAFTKDVSGDDLTARRLFLTGGAISTLVSGGTATAVSSFVSLIAAKAIGAPTAAVCAVCGAIGGLGFGAWLTIKFAKELSDKHPGLVGLALVGGWLAIGAPLAIGASGAAGAIGLGSIGLTSSFLMAQAVGFGAFKATLIVMEPLCEHTIGAGFAALAKQYCPPEESSKEKLNEVYGLSNNTSTKKSEFTEKDRETLETFCKTPMSHASKYWYDTIFSPPIHEGLEKYMHYVPWGKETKTLTVITHSNNTPISIPIDDKNTSELSSLSNRHSTAIEPENQKPSFLKAASSTVTKCAKAAKHAIQTMGHRFTFQAFRKLPEKSQVETVFQDLSDISQRRGFTNAAQAWENFDQIERRFGRKLPKNMDKAELTHLVTQARTAVENNYGPRPGAAEVLTCGLFTRGRAEKLNALIRAYNATNTYGQYFGQ